ncbi:MAG: thermonuclease family protein [Leptospiraceae bacterium]|nr:thermonuclease family protein [Leptospiraceae bacterium]
MATESSGISSTQYNSILKDISKIYEQSLNDGNEDWNKTVLSSNWQIGQRIIEVTQEKKARASYGDRVLSQLSKDLTRKYSKGFSERNLGYIRKFYQYYKSGNFHSELSWSHYVCLLLIENETTRLTLEKNAIQKKLTSRDLLTIVKQELARTKGKSQSDNRGESTADTLTRPILQLYTYRIVRKYKDNSTTSLPHLDLGFSILLEEKDNLSKFKIGSIIESAKDNKTYSFKLNSNVKELFTYKAHLERVIDGDTLLVNIDLGFSVSIEQRLRLRGLDAPELSTKKGISSKKFVESCLKDCRFLIIKTHGKDKYDRYLVDVFYLKNETDEEKVIKEGLFLNNELLVGNYAVRM